MTQWEYNVVTIAKEQDDASLEQVLDERGGKGWELVGMVECSGGSAIKHVFKRRVS